MLSANLLRVSQEARSRRTNQSGFERAPSQRAGSFGRRGGHESVGTGAAYGRNGVDNVADGGQVGTGRARHARAQQGRRTAGGSAVDAGGGADQAAAKCVGAGSGGGYAGAPG